jgi:hypothetical protein
VSTDRKIRFHHNLTKQYEGLKGEERKNKIYICRPIFLPYSLVLLIVNEKNMEYCSWLRQVMKQWRAAHMKVREPVDENKKRGASTQKHSSKPPFIKVANNQYKLRLSRLNKHLLNLNQI